MTASDDKEPSTAGWDAINAALAKVYGQGEPPYHYGTVLPAALGGKDPLQGISVYQRDAPVPHWHYITYGFSELYDKESEDPEVSGFGFEMTFRLALYEEEPPRWALNLLQNLARYVFRSGNPFDAGHYLDCQGPIALGQATDVRGARHVHSKRQLRLGHAGRQTGAPYEPVSRWCIVRRLAAA